MHLRDRGEGKGLKPRHIGCRLSEETNVVLSELDPPITVHPLTNPLNPATEPQKPRMEEPN